MKIDGMDAATKPVAAPVLTHDPTTAGTPGDLKNKAAEIRNMPGAAGSGGKKAHGASERPAIERKPPQQDEDLTEAEIREAVERANRALFGNDRKFEIEIHEKTKDIMVRVVDTKTNETIREIPPKKIVDLVVKLCEIAGILYDEKG